MSNLINKAKDTLSSNKDHSASTTHGGTGSTGAYDNPRSTNAGPHGSNMANKVDPRIDSDRDNRNDPTSRVGGYGTQNTGAGGIGGTGTHTGTHAPGVGGTGAGFGTGTSTNAGYGTGSGMTSGTHGTHGASHGTTGAGYNDPHSANAGPHSSNLANKLDPRVDSDRDNRNDPSSRVGGYGTQDTYGSGTTGHGATGAYHATTGTTTGAGIGGTSGAQYDDPRSANAGPHSSNLMNKADPRIDSDRDNRNNPVSSTGGYGQTQTQGAGMTGGTGGAGYGTTGTTGTHGVGHGATGAAGGYGAGSGTANDGSTTVQGIPSDQKATHNSQLLNKLDPRVKNDKEGNPLH
ncbi:uncharacterized protein A1O9_11127 [Exophiala aquamarina CBS 119918]|uniref:Period circadian protein n=1 Tax=Exophiala aquamarina CBS 119918 TaxID=1182545 RepID=A0A072PAW3_9EURO|nr:uncharacterized protein A1O9_11127 [Exophiala aquamarina CBS 119918]KEF52710.1 hypothetical protein A1O9_11127 [Exophiala aquamarina CBS 119918]